MISYNIRNILQLTNERKKCVIDLHFNQHKTCAEITQIERISPRDIHAIIKEEEANDKNMSISKSNKRHLPKPMNYFLRERNL
jgi:hypothetical protein